MPHPTISENQTFINLTETSLSYCFIFGTVNLEVFRLVLGSGKEDILLLGLVKSLVLKLLFRGMERRKNKIFDRVGLLVAN